MVLQQLDCLGTSAVQQVDPAVDVREVDVEGPRQPFLAGTLSMARLSM
jgi:hypothetical protein